jgi:hypothetical protein
MNCGSVKQLSTRFAGTPLSAPSRRGRGPVTFADLHRGHSRLIDGPPASCWHIFDTLTSFNCTGDAVRTIKTMALMH